MSNDKENQVKDNLTSQTALLAQILAELKAMNAGSAPNSPNYRRKLAEYRSFDWRSIGASVMSTDNNGVVEVEWQGHRFDRAMGNKFNSEFVIFSRPAADWSNENKSYNTLIKFADYNDTPIQPTNGQTAQPSRSKPATAKPPAPAEYLDEIFPHPSKNELIAPPISKHTDPRLCFYDIGGKAVAEDIITVDKFNSLASKAKRVGFADALVELKAILA